MQVLKQGDRVKAIRQFKAPYNDTIIQENDEGTVYAIGPAWDQDEKVLHVGINLDNGKEVSVPYVNSHIFWRVI